MPKYWLFAIWLLYLIWPRDLIPDFVPLLGRVDDLLLLFLLWYYVFRKKPGAAQAPGGSGGYSEDPRTGSGNESSSYGRSFSREGQSGRDPYRILGVDRRAGIEEIRQAYRTLASKYHPDKVAHLGEDLQELAKVKFQEIGWAYEKILQEKNGGRTRA